MANHSLLVSLDELYERGKQYTDEFKVNWRENNNSINLAQLEPGAKSIWLAYNKIRLDNTLEEEQIFFNFFARLLGRTEKCHQCGYYTILREHNCILNEIYPKKTFDDRRLMRK